MQNTYNLAIKTNDTESLIEINNQLAELYLSQNLADKALIQLKKSLQYKPFSYPFDFLQSKSHQLNNDLIKALELANHCKNKANEFWRIEDEEYLAQLIAQVNSL